MLGEGDLLPLLLAGVLLRGNINCNGEDGVKDLLDKLSLDPRGTLRFFKPRLFDLTVDFILPFGEEGALETDEDEHFASGDTFKTDCVFD